MFKFIDNFLNKTTMYRLVLYVLLFFFMSALALSFFGFLPYGPVDLIASVIIIMAVCWITNTIFAKVFEAPTNIESIYITALILVLIITPPQSGDYTQFATLAIWASIWAMASKFILAIKKKHLFNPAAFAVMLTALTLNESASWWVGTKYMLPFIIIGGSLIVRKIRRADLMWSFLIAAIATTVIGFWLFKGANPLTSFNKTVFDSALFFFATIMLTEPLTTPPTKWLRISYGALVGFLFSPAIHIGAFYTTPEIALVLGNIFSYTVSPKEKLILKLKQAIKIATDTYEFVFPSTKAFSFTPGEYMEWTLPHRDPDSRGNRRYFTIASSPTEKDIRLGVKFYAEPSSFKNHMFSMKPNATIVAAQRAGDFLMPKDKNQKLVFIAGGIGVTPFRSMIQYLLDIKEKRTITMFYSNKTPPDIAYKDVFDRAAAELGLKTIYAITDPGTVPTWPSVRQGFIDAKMIQTEVPDYRERIFYLSGPHSMVTAFEVTLQKMGVSKSHIKTDYFPGFA